MKSRVRCGSKLTGSQPRVFIDGENTDYHAKVVDTDCSCTRCECKYRKSDAAGSGSPEGIHAAASLVTSRCGPDSRATQRNRYAWSRFRIWVVFGL